MQYSYRPHDGTAEQNMHTHTHPHICPSPTHAHTYTQQQQSHKCCTGYQSVHCTAEVSSMLNLMEVFSLPGPSSGSRTVAVSISSREGRGGQGGEGVMEREKAVREWRRERYVGGFVLRGKMLHSGRFLLPSQADLCCRWPCLEIITWTQRAHTEMSSTAAEVTFGC